MLLLKDDDLTRDTDWSTEGYSVQRFLGAGDYARLVSGVQELIAREMSSFVDPAMQSSFRLENYHNFVETDERHLGLVNRTREGFPLVDLPVDLPLLEARLSEICGAEITAANPKFKSQIFFIRIIRPAGKPDNNPPHRDVWLNYYRSCINIYVPLAGSNELSSLPMVAGSHLWKESEIQRTIAGAKVQGVAYRVPSVTEAKRPLVFVRPNPKPNEMIVFSPYLIHGGGVNLNSDQTRVSLEMRFFRK